MERNSPGEQRFAKRLVFLLDKIEILLISGIKKRTRCIRKLAS